MPASICPIRVVGTRMWATPRRMSEAESVTMLVEPPSPTFSAPSNVVDRMARLPHRPFRHERLGTVPTQRRARRIHHPLRPHRLRQVTADRARVSGTDGVEERPALREKNVLDWREIASVAERRGRRPLEVPAVQDDLSARRKHATSDLLLIREGAADDGP